MVSDIYFLPYVLGDIHKTIDKEFHHLIDESRVLPNFTWSLYSVENGVIACGGFSALHAGVFELWYNPPEIIKKYPISIIKKAREQVNFLAREEGVIRIQTQLATDVPARDHLMKCLGFENEGILRKFIDGKDYVMYARVQ